MLRTRSGRNPSQNEFELRTFIELLNKRGVKSYAEIGARHGDTFWDVMTSLPKGSKGLAVDLPGGLWGTSKSRSALELCVRDLVKLGYQASVLFGDSHTDATRRLVIGRGPFDAILIDGDHTLPGVTKDFDNYGKLAPVVAFHDIVGTGQAENVSHRQVEVPLFWECVKHRHENLEFVDAGSKMGIGVLLT